MIAIGTFLRTKRVDRLWVKHPYVYHDSLADEHRPSELKQCRPPRSGLDVDMRREALARARCLGRWLPGTSHIAGERKPSSPSEIFSGSTKPSGSEVVSVASLLGRFVQPDSWPAGRGPHCNCETRNFLNAVLVIAPHSQHRGSGDKERAQRRRTTDEHAHCPAFWSDETLFSDRFVCEKWAIPSQILASCGRVSSDEPRLGHPGSGHHHRSSLGQPLGNVAKPHEPLLDFEPGDELRYAVCGDGHHDRHSGAGGQCAGICRYPHNGGRPAGT